MPSTPTVPTWLSPRRRRTTSNLPRVNVNANGQANVALPDETLPTTPPNGPSTPERPPLSPSPRPFSQPVISNQHGAEPVAETDGNLFYAYARRGNDLKSRFLLTFASVTVANEWWSLLQTNFPSTSRPGPQLFSFSEPPDLLARAWKHPAFEHLKSKWMYISFSDTTEGGLGGAAQGIIPVQDARGNLLGGRGLEPSSPELLGQMGEVKRQTRSVRHDITRLEEYFTKMMEAVDRNTQQVAKLAESHEPAHAANGNEEHNDAALSDLSTHLGRINIMLEQHSANMEGLAKQQSDHDEKLRDALQDSVSRQKNDYLDMSQLSSHLDRIQHLMEQNSVERKDSARDLSERPAQVDFSPLIGKLDAFLEHQSRDRDDVRRQPDLEPLIGKLDAFLDHASKPKDEPQPQTQVDLKVLIDKLDVFIDGQSKSKEEAPPQPDFSPLMNKIDAFIELQSRPREVLPQPDFSPLLGKIDALIEHLSKPKDIQSQPDFSPLLNKIDALIEQQSRPKEVQPQPDFDPLISKLDALLEHQSKPTQLDFSPLTAKLERVQEAVEQNSALIKALLDEGTAPDSKPSTPFWGKDAASTPAPQIDLSPMTQQLEKIFDAITQQSQHMQALVGFATAGNEDGEEISGGAAAGSGSGDTAEKSLAPLGEHLEQIYNAIEEGNSYARSVGRVSLQPLVEKMDEMLKATEASKLDLDVAPLGEKMNDLEKHLQELVRGSEGVNERLDAYLQHHAKLENGLLEPRQPEINLEPLTERFDGLGDHLANIVSFSDRTHERTKELVLAQDRLREAFASSSQAQVDFSPLTEQLGEVNAHLEALREWAEFDSEQLQQLVESQKPSEEEEGEDGEEGGEAEEDPSAAQLNSQLEALRAATEENAAQMRALLETHKTPQHVPEIDFTPLTERLNRIHKSLESRDKTSGTGDAKFIMNALTSHLSKIQAVTEANAQHVKALRERSTTSHDELRQALARTSESIATLAQAQQSQDKSAGQQEQARSEAHRTQFARIDAVSGQVKDLMTSQKETVEVLKELSSSLKLQSAQMAANVGGTKSCDHVIVPPPRKMDRKIVGFVYDGKQGRGGTSTGPVSPRGSRGGEDMFRGL